MSIEIVLATTIQLLSPYLLVGTTEMTKEATKDLWKLIKSYLTSNEQTTVINAIDQESFREEDVELFKSYLLNLMVTDSNFLSKIKSSIDKVTETNKNIYVNNTHYGSGDINNTF